jgi:hypothetical protein
MVGGDEVVWHGFVFVYTSVRTAAKRSGPRRDDVCEMTMSIAEICYG